MKMARIPSKRRLSHSIERLEFRQLLAVGTFDGVKAISIALDSSGTANNTVTLQLDGACVDRVVANLGAGDNSLTHTGEIAGDLQVTSKTGTDKVTVSTDAIVGGKTVQKLGVDVHRGHARMTAARGRR